MANLLFKRRLYHAIEIILRKNLGIKEDESVLIIYDQHKKELAEKFFQHIIILAPNTKKMRIAALLVNGQEPAKQVSFALRNANVALILTSKSLSHTKARREATSHGARIASMPGITEDILSRSIDINYELLKADSKRVGNLLSKASTARIITSLGTDLSFSLKGRKAHGFSAGIFTAKGKWGNLPEGEAYIAPVEGTASGHFVVDGSIAGMGRAHHPVIIFVENGLAIRITDGKKPVQLEKMIEDAGDKARNIAEFGIGLNRKAKVTGCVLEDEKAYGTCHIALGNNIGFGGAVDVQFHVDCVIQKPSIWLDKKFIMKKGKLLV